MTGPSENPGCAAQRQVLDGTVGAGQREAVGDSAGRPHSGQGMRISICFSCRASPGPGLTGRVPDLAVSGAAEDIVMWRRDVMRPPPGGTASWTIRPEAEGP